MAAPDRCAVPEPPSLVHAPWPPAGRSPAVPVERDALRLRSLTWAGLSAVAAALVALLLALLGVWTLPARVPGAPLITTSAIDLLLRSAGCSFFLGLLAFHLQRVDPDDSHLQAGLVGAVCGIRSLGAGIAHPPLPQALNAAELLRLAPSLMMELAMGWLPLWLPVIGGAVVLHGLRQWLPSPQGLPALQELPATRPLSDTQAGPAPATPAGPAPDPLNAPPPALRP